jgi:hypothetical protein
VQASTYKSVSQPCDQYQNELIVLVRLGLHTVYVCSYGTLAASDNNIASGTKSFPTPIGDFKTEHYGPGTYPFYGGKKLFTNVQELFAVTTIDGEQYGFFMHDKFGEVSHGCIGIGKDLQKYFLKNPLPEGTHFRIEE